MNTPQKLGKHELLEKIGEGGFGIVYRGRDTRLDRIVAIKVLDARLNTAPDFVERFHREARLASALRHPNIVTVIDVDEHEGRYFLVMDYLPGGTLSQRMADSKPLPLKQAVEILRPVASALDYAHSREIIHRDVKPANILFAEDGRPVLTDFGLVKSLAETGNTTTGILLGTVEYMAPEQITGGQVGPASDRYALGVVAYHLLTGQPPFKGRTPFEVQSGHVNQPPPDPRSLNPALPDEAAQALLSALDKEPARRFASSAEFVAALEQAVKQLDQAQLQDLLSQANSRLEEFEFDRAIDLLQQALAVSPTPQAQELFEKCQQRKLIWDELHELQAKRAEIEERIQKINEKNRWLEEPEITNITSPSPKKRGIQREQAAPDAELVSESMETLIRAGIRFEEEPDDVNVGSSRQKMRGRYRDPIPKPDDTANYFFAIIVLVSILLILFVLLNGQF